MSHLLSILLLLHKMRASSSAAGISFKSQLLYLLVYATRYADLFWTFGRSPYNTLFKLLFLASSVYVVWLMLRRYRPTHDAGADTFRAQYLLAGSALLALLFPYKWTWYEVVWAFSIWLEAVAILPQLFLLQRTGEAETITTHYLCALGAYRAFYIPNWVYRYAVEGKRDPIAWVAGVLQTLLYTDFFWIYYQRWVVFFFPFCFLLLNFDSYILEEGYIYIYTPLFFSFICK
jgi:ER lumen protein retaining receptor